MKRFIVILHLTLTACWISGQDRVPDSVYTLPHVEISSSRVKDFTAGQKTAHLDSISLSDAGVSGLGEILYRNTALNINRYNHNGLNLLSVRGTTASQSSIYWNGVQINPPNNGMMDLTLIPGNYFSDVSVVYGGSSSLYGSGNIGVGIHLNSHPVFVPLKRLEVGATAGSFDDYAGNLKGVYANKKWFFNTQLMTRSALNDFEYTNLNGESQNFQNAALKQRGVMQDIYRKFGQNTVAGISLWYQENDKQVPATLTSKPSDAQQNDRSLRGIASFKQYYRKGQLSASMAVFNDYQHYLDPDSQQALIIDSEIETTRFQGEISGEKQVFNNTMVSTGLGMSQLKGKSVNYPQTIQQNQAGLFLLISQFIPQMGWKFNINLRQELNSDYTIPFMPAFGMEGPIWKNLSGRATVSRNFRVPTFNDLYWVPGGNPDLMPESSWNQEAGILYVTDTSAELRIKAGITAFNSNVENWIMWVPDGNLWSPLNVQKVWARGLEGDLEIKQNNRTIQWSVKAGYSYTRSTNEKKLSENDPAFQKQLTYVPYHRAHFNLHVGWKSWVFRADEGITGPRYVTADNTEKLAGYALLDMSLGHTFYPGEQKLTVRAGVQNIMNTDYQAVQYYPMPGRSVNLAINLIIQ
jgi:iron complex outermembrane receptor protein